MSVQKLLGTGSLAILDQIWLSVINLTIAIVFIKAATKEEYGLYMLLFTPLLLAQGIQNALLNAPFTTLYPVKSKVEKGSYARALFLGHFVLGIFLFVIALVGLMGYTYYSDNEIDWFLSISFALSVLGVLCREGLRSFFYAKQQVYKAFLGDFLYGSLLLLGLGYIFFKSSVEASFVLLFIGVSGLAVSIFQLFQYSYLLRSTTNFISIFSEFWLYGRWALRGVVITWINLNSYPFFVGIIFGVAAVADISAARLFWMPAALFITAWSSLFRPVITQWFSHSEITKIKKVSYQSIFIGSILYLIALIIVIQLFPWIERYFLGDQYQNLLTLVLCWSLFFLFQFYRTVFMATLMVNEDGYKKLSSVAWLSLVLMILFMSIALNYSLVVVVLALVLIEFIQFIVIFYFTRVHWTRRLEN